MNAQDKDEHRRSSSTSEVERGFSRRLVKLKGEKSVSQFAQECGIGESLMRKYLAGSTPGVDKAVEIARRTGVTISWLATGDDPVASPGISDAPGGHNLGDEFALVPVYSVVASAGHGAAIDQELIESQIAFRKDWMHREGLYTEGLAAIRAIGDSMEPTIRPGALLLVDSTQRKIGNDDIYVIRLDDNLLAKRLQRRINGSVIVSSDNPSYQMEEVPHDQVARLDIIGRVVWVGQRL